MPGGAEITASARSRPRALVRRGAGYEVTPRPSARTTPRRRPGVMVREVTMIVSSPRNGRGTFRQRASGRQASPVAVTLARTAPDRARRTSTRHWSWPGGRRTSGGRAKTGVPAAVVTPGIGRPVRNTGFVRPRTTRRPPSARVSVSRRASHDASRRSSWTSRQPRQVSGSVLVITVLSGTSDRSSAVTGQTAQTASAGSTGPASPPSASKTSSRSASRAATPGSPASSGGTGRACPEAVSTRRTPPPNGSNRRPAVPPPSPATPPGSPSSGFAPSPPRPGAAACASTASSAVDPVPGIPSVPSAVRKALPHSPAERPLRRSPAARCQAGQKDPVPAAAATRASATMTQAGHRSAAPPGGRLRDCSPRAAAAARTTPGSTSRWPTGTPAASSRLQPGSSRSRSALSATAPLIRPIDINLTIRSARAGTQAAASQSPVRGGKNETEPLTAGQHRTGLVCRHPEDWSRPMQTAVCSVFARMPRLRR